MTEAIATDTATPAAAAQVRPVLDVRNLCTTFATETGTITPVDDVSLTVPRGKTVALVGESGCGKSVTALSIMRLIPQPPGRIEGGQILFDDFQKQGHGQAKTDTASGASPHQDQPTDLLRLNEKQMRRVRGNRIAMIFQDPMTALNPVMTIGDQVVEAIELHRPLRGRASRTEAVALLRKVGIPSPQERVESYPHQMSGGMLQRVMIAMALSCEPSLLIADEPTTALDVTIQRQVLDLLAALQSETGMSVLIITHDLGVVAQIADYVYVMYAGRVVEHAATRVLLSRPLHPYTQGLLRCMPRMSDSCERLETIPGQVPDPSNFPTGCRFHPRCRLSADLAEKGERAVVPVDPDGRMTVLRRCVERFEDEPSGQPALRELRPGHYVSCWEAG